MHNPKLRPKKHIFVFIYFYNVDNVDNVDIAASPSSGNQSSASRVRFMTINVNLQSFKTHKMQVLTERQLIMAQIFRADAQPIHPLRTVLMEGEMCL